MYGCETYTIKRTQYWRIEAFKLWCWRRLFSLWTARRSNQSILKEINPEYSLEGLMLKLKLQYLATWCEELLTGKGPDAGKIEGKRRRGWQRMRWSDSITNSVHVNLSKLQDIVKDRETWCAGNHGVAKSWTWLSDWPTILEWKMNIVKLQIKYLRNYCWLLH